MRHYIDSLQSMPNRSWYIIEFFHVIISLINHNLAFMFFTGVCTMVILSSLICLTNSNTLILSVSLPCFNKESRPMNVPVLPTPALKQWKEKQLFWSLDEYPSLLFKHRFFCAGKNCRFQCFQLFPYSIWCRLFAKGMFPFLLWVIIIVFFINYH